MSFLDDVREFLRHPAALPIGDMRRYRRHLVSLLKRLEAEGADPAQLAQRGDMLRRRFDAFVPALEQRLLTEGIPPADIPELVEYAIATQLGIRDEPISATYSMVVAGAMPGLQYALDENEPWRNIAQYAHEIHAVRLRSNNIEITEIGRVLLELAGKEAIKWLLHVEVALTTGHWDPWRVDRGTLRELARSPEFVLLAHETEDSQSIHRLAWLGLLDLINEGVHGEEAYRVHEHALPILREVGEGHDTPMSVLVAALLEDDVRDRLPVRGVASTSQAMVRQARHVIHEINNALVPVRVALKRIYKEAERAGTEERIVIYRQRVDQGVERVLAFAREMKTMARLSGEVKEPFDIYAALREAAGEMAAEGGHRPEIVTPEQQVTSFGVRHRFVRAVIDLVRNAYQLAPRKSPQVNISMTTEGKRICVTIDDNGPGVAPEDRDRIFLDGYSTRAQGMGFGLGLARAVIEESMGGTLTCEDGSLLGGARFVIMVPRYNGSTQ